MSDEQNQNELVEALAEMREEATRISELATSIEQVDAAEAFATSAGTLDERIGSAARDAE